MTGLRRTALLALGLLAAGVAVAAAAPRGEAPAAPPPPSVPAVTRAEADALFAALGAAWKHEDLEALTRIHDVPLQPLARRNAQRIFTKCNYFNFDVRIDGETAREDGSLELTGVTELESRDLQEAWPRRDKKRWTFVVARRPGAGVVLASQEPAEAGLLPSSPPWRHPDVSGEVRLDGLEAKRPSMTLSLVLGLVNASAEPAAELAFALHPFASGVVARLGEAVLPARRIEASLDAWFVTLPAPVPPGERTTVRLEYRLEQPGDIASAAIGPGLVRLYAASAWLPKVEPPRGDAPPLRRHDLVVVMPAGVEASMPGTRTEAEAPSPGWHAVRFVTDVPALEVPLVAARAARTEVRLGPSLVLDVLRRPGGDDPAKFVSHVTTLAAFLEDHLGPCPVRRLALVDAGGETFREAPAWMAVPSMTPPPSESMLPESRQPSFFLGLAMARLWVVHERAPTGVGARDVAHGLCEHLLGEWMGAVVDPNLPLRQRDELLSFVKLDPQLDRPLLPFAVEQPAPRIFKSGKARMVFDMYELLVGAPAWRDILLRWRRDVPAGSSIHELVKLMGGTPEKDAFLDAFLMRQGASQVSIHDVRVLSLTPDEVARLGLDPDAWHAVEIELANTGLGPVPVALRIQVDGAFRDERLLVPEAGRATLRFPAGGGPNRIRIDPNRVLWQGNTGDDTWPPEKPGKKRDFGRVVVGSRTNVPETEVRQDPGPK